MKAVYYTLTKNQLDEIAALAADKAIEAYRTEQQKNERKHEKELVRSTKHMLSSYRRIKATLKETEEFTEDEKIELRWEFVNDLMGNKFDDIERAENRIKALERKRKKDSFEIQMIDKAMRLYKKEIDSMSNEEAKRRYRELYAMYIDDIAMSVKEIAFNEGVSEKIVYRDLGIAYKIVTVYLFGM